MLSKKIERVLNNAEIVYNAPNGYQLIAKTAKYALVLMHGCFRVENWKGVYFKEVQHIEIPPELADQYLDYLLGWKYADKGEKQEAKADGIRQFNLECDEMFNDEHTELYPESVA